MQVCTSLQTDNHASTQQLSFLQAGCPSSRPTNSVKALKAVYKTENVMEKLKKTKTDMLGRNDNGKSDHLRLVVFSGLCRTSVVAVLMWNSSLLIYNHSNQPLITYIHWPLQPNMPPSTLSWLLLYRQICTKLSTHQTQNQIYVK